MPGEHTLAEIGEGAAAVEKTLAKASELQGLAEHFRKMKKVYLTGSGSSYWAAYFASELLRAGGLDATAVVASELYLSDYPESKDTLVVVFSQSGETTEALKAATEARALGAPVLAITNRSRSSLEKIADHHFTTPAGEEHVLATKSFDAALAAAYIFAQSLIGRDGGDLDNIGSLYSKVMRLDLGQAVRLLAPHERAYALGIDHDFAIAGEAAIKLSEGALIQVTPLPALEISHGPKANILGVPVIVIGLRLKYRRIYEDLIAEIKKAGALVLALSALNLPFPKTTNIEVPGTDDLTVFTGVKLAQRLAVAAALAKGLDPDKPRTLKKFVVRENL